MAEFKAPRIDPYNYYRPQGTSNVKSKFLPNDYYYIDYTPFWWRTAMDQAKNYSDLTMVDALYSWAIESSPFLRSQLNKRLNPIMRRQFQYVDSNGNRVDDFTDEVVTKKWFKQLRRQHLLAAFYGVRVVGIDIKTGTVKNYPLRNIDIVNQGIRAATYDITEIAVVADYDNIFFIQPETDEDFQLGLLEPITRAMIGYIDAYNNWAVTGKSYSYPKMVVMYNSANPELEAKAKMVAENIDDPTSVAILPGRMNLNDKEMQAEISVKPIQSQAYPNAHETFRGLTDSWKQEIMQLVTGGTLLGATEKNTNSEQLARIHVKLYKDILDEDCLQYVDWVNSYEVRNKLTALFGDERFLQYRLEEIADRSIDIYDFEKIIKGMSQVGHQPTPEFYEKVGIEASDINTGIRNGNWMERKLSDNKLGAQIKELLSKVRLNNSKAKSEENGDGSRTGGNAAPDTDGNTE